MRVKTPTAAAEWLIAGAVESLDRLQRTGDEILAVASQRISGCLTQLSYYEGVLPTAARAAVDRSRSFIDSARISLAGIGVRASCRPGHLDASAGTRHSLRYCGKPCLRPIGGIQHPVKGIVARGHHEAWLLGDLYLRRSHRQKRCRPCRWCRDSDSVGRRQRDLCGE